MALRNKPYLPLYVQDYMTDEKLAQCSALAHGVYIQLMCVMHKSEHYGKILLKQKDKQKEQQVENFATKVAKQMPFNIGVIIDGLTELLDEKVLVIDGDFLIQKRMVKDNEISEKRSESGGKGGKETAKKFPKAKSKAKPKAKTAANRDNDNDIVIVNEDENKLTKEWQGAIDSFLEMRRTIKKPATPRAVELIIDELEKLAPKDTDTQIKILNQSTKKCWQDVYPLKNPNSAEPYQQPQSKEYI
jgi:uncharacterized protein YdaU (DUF1376 family)